MSDNEQQREFSFKSYFVPLTTVKSIHIIFFIGFVFFGNMLFNGFVLDDIPQLVTNNSLHSLTKIPEIFFSPLNAKEVSSYYRPLSLTFYTVIYTIFKDQAFFYHLFQLLLYICNSIFIFLIFKKFLKPGIAFFLSLFFLVHPINQETAAYIANLQDVLFVFWGLLAFYLLQKSTITHKHIVLINIFLLLSLLSKESGVLFVFVTFLYVFLFKRRIFLLNITASSPMILVYLALRIASRVPLHKEAGIPIMALPFWERMMHIPIILFTYLKTFIFPRDLVALQTWVIPGVNASTFYLPLVFDLVFFSLLLIFCFFIYYKTKEIKLQLFFLAWMGMGLFIHLQIIPIDATVGNRYFYFSMIGLLAIIGLFIQSLKLKKSFITLGIVCGVVLVSVFSIRTMIRNFDWKDQQRLISHDIALSKDDYIMEYLYGIELIKTNQVELGLQHTQKALKLFPQSWNAWNNLGIIYSKKGDYTRARDAYLRSISINKTFGAYENLASLMLQHDDLNKSRSFIVDALKIYPNSQKLLYFQVVAEYKSGNYENAVKAARRLYSIRQDQASYTFYQRLLQKQSPDIAPK